ncbi:hypothetical protein BJV78DRAFT_1159215 [Lactifluus subvellereus]|nr:hypothetical protein BJV78DRAFT_1159215 [Lactifluus subvellereus]
MEKNSKVKAVPIIFPSNDTAVTAGAKKSKLAAQALSPSGLIKGFVPTPVSAATSQAATNRWATEVAVQAIQAQAAASLCGESERIGVEFKMGGLEVIDDDGVEIVERKYPKYALVKPEGRKSECFEAVAGVIPNRPAEHLGASSTIKNATKESKTTFVNADLPVACLILWNRQYVPLLVDWAGTLPNPWKCHDVDIQRNIQAMWDTVYPDIAADIQPKRPIFVWSIQRITEWRGIFGSGAITALENIWLDKGSCTPEGRKKYATHMLSRGLPFMWRAFNSSLSKGSRLFQSEPILSTLASHFIATSSLSNETRSTEYPKGALLLTVVGHEHALKLYVDTGKVVPHAQKRNNHFSEEIWSDAALRYQVSIEGLSDETWDDIIDGAWKISQEKETRASRGTASSSFSDAKMPEADKRELLVKGSEIVENDNEIDWDTCEPSQVYEPFRD